MGNSAYKLPDKPFFTKLGFFTKKGYAVSLSFVVIIDYIYVLIIGKDKLKILLFGMPYTVFILVFYHLIFIGGLFIFSKIKSLLGIDITANHQEQDLPVPLITPLFTEKGFQDFQSYALRRLNKRWITYGAIFFALLIVFFILWGPILFFQADEWIDNFPELAENGLYYVYLVFRIGPLSLYLLWFSFSVLSLLFLIIEVMIIFNALGNFSGLSLSKISEYFDSSIVNEKSTDFYQNSEIVQFSLKRFRRKCKIIPEMFLKINLGVSLATFVLGILFSIYTSYTLQEEAKSFAISFFFPIIAGVMLFNLIVFIFPQLSLHRHLARVKEFILEKFEEIYEIKRFQYLNFAFNDNLEEKNSLLSELQTLNQMIVDIEDIPTWPFNYNHLTTLFIGLIFPFLPLIFEILFL
ncbi:MAG: hypothetical protein ACFFAJ_16545 [Candidatus Hodarchaeota archaeon]